MLTGSMAHYDEPCGDIQQLLSYYIHSPLESQKAVTAYLRSKQLLPFGFALQYSAQ